MKTYTIGDEEIVEICKPEYETVYKKSETQKTEDEEDKKEMTISEIEKELGYSIKLVAEREEK